MICTATALVLAASSLAVSVVAGAATSTVPTAPAASTPGVNGPIVFDRRSSSSGVSEIFRMNGDGSGSTQLTNNADHDIQPEFSPDGSEIVFASDRGGDLDLYIMRADGTGTSQLIDRTEADSDPQWSPEGQHVVFNSRSNGGRVDIYRVNSDGSGLIRLNPSDCTGCPSLISARDPSYSPDGRHIVFAAQDESGAVLYRMDSDGRNAVRLESSSNEFEVGTPVYSPDGTHIVFEYEGRAEDGIGIAQISADDSGPQVKLRGLQDPAYSPDGAYVVSSNGGEIVVVNSDFTGSTPLTSSAEIERSPSWGPAYVPCRGHVPTIVGTRHDDVLTGTPGTDVIIGHGGDDVVDAGGGADVICGGAGSDTVSYGTHELDVTADLEGEDGDDGSAEDGPPGARDSIGGDVERLVGGYGDDDLAGGPGANVITGGPGDDTLVGGGGDDTLTGDSGDDVLLGEGGDDRLRGRSGLDSITGGDGDDSLDGGDDGDNLDGGPGVDTATYVARDTGVSASLGAGVGDDGNAVDGPRDHRDTLRNTVERLVGGRGDDVLAGSLLDNRLTGGLGADRLLGRAGRDVLVADDGIADLLINCGDGTDRTPNIDAGIDPVPVNCP